MKELASTIRSKAGILSLGALLPLLLVLTVQEVPRFVFADCPYYTCDETNEYFKLVAAPTEISLNETSSLEAFNGACPCSWQITSQPGGWTIDDHGSCKATLRPINEFGSPGEITVAVASDQCQDSVTITAGCFNFAVQASVDDGATWHDEVFIEGNPGLTVDVPVRVVMTATTDETEAWSYSIKHDASLLEGNGGDIEVAWATIDTTQAADLVPEFDETEARVDAADNSIGYTQGVVIDYEGGAWLDPSVGFVTSAACYRITMPAEGFYQVDLSLVDDIGDGRPPIETLIVQNAESIYPCFRNLTIHIESSASVTHPTLTCTGVSYVDPAEDGTPGPGGGGKVFANRKGPPPDAEPCDKVATSEVILPVSCGDSDADGRVNVTDAVMIFNHMFLGEPAEAKVVSTGYLTTRQMTCWDDVVTQIIPCPTEGAFSGQDGRYQKGVPRSYIDIGSTVVDVRTGLMWLKNPAGTLGALETAEAMIDNLNANATAGFDTWRLPTVREALSIVDYDPTTPDFDPVFGFGNITGLMWTSTPYAPPDPVDPVGITDRQWLVHALGRTTADRTSEQADAHAVATLTCRELPPGHDDAPRVKPRDVGGSLTLGDAYGDGQLGIEDPIAILYFLFRETRPPCVLPGAAEVEFPPDRFEVDAVNGIVNDTHTGLLWSQTPLAPRIWEFALRDSEGLTVQIDPQTTLPDWRLPNVFEILTLVDFQKTTVPALPGEFSVAAGCAEGCVDPDDPGDCFRCDRPFWTSSTSTDEFRIGGETGPGFAYHLFINDVLIERSGYNLASGKLGDSTATTQPERRFGDKDVQDVTSWVLPVHDDPAASSP